VKPDLRFLNRPKHFWANVRSVSQHLGYTARGTGQILVPDLDAIVRALRELDLGTDHLVSEGAPLRTFARRVDGAFPAAKNPIAIWEIKEYYHTTTFGSRVADGVYETLLDGMELEELRQSERVGCKHHLIIDAHFTWWECGRSYLCRIVDMLHMGYVDEVLVGAEVLDRIPKLAKEWVGLLKAREKNRQGRKK
jgi:hypothetical protein